MENNIPNNDYNNIPNHAPESNPYNNPNNIPNNMSGSDPNNNTYNGPYNGPYSDPYNNPSNMSGAVPYNIPEEYKPISMWGYVGYLFLFAIPLVGFVLAIVFGFGGAGKQSINLRNFARAIFVFYLIFIALDILIYVGIILSAMLIATGC